jgi:hypothetical protein
MYKVKINRKRHVMSIKHVSRRVIVRGSSKRGLPGEKGDKGDTPLAIQPEAPMHEDWLWVDTDDELDSSDIPVTIGDLLSLYVQFAANPDAIIFGPITRDVNGAVTSAGVIWPDLTPGTYTSTELSILFPGAVDGYEISYDGIVQKTYIQPPVTRDITGAVILRPEIEVS